MNGIRNVMVNIIMCSRSAVKCLVDERATIMTIMYLSLCTFISIDQGKFFYILELKNMFPYMTINKFSGYFTTVEQKVLLSKRCTKILY